MTTDKLKVAATLNILIGGVPSIYYGQELGMKGKQINGTTDGNDIPIREAFEWSATGTGKGMALWYKNTGPWWDSTSVKPNDGISVEEQRKDPGSLWNHYRKIIALRKSSSALSSGKYRTVANENDNVVSFLRYTPDETVLVVVNLSAENQHATVSFSPEDQFKSASGLNTKASIKIANSSIGVSVSPYNVKVFRLK